MLINENVVELKAPLDNKQGIEFISRNFSGDNTAMVFTNQDDYLQDFVGLTHGESYTFSCYVRLVNGHSKKISARAYGTDCEFDLGANYSRISHTFKYDANFKYKNIYVFIGKDGETSGNKIAIKCPKLEVGEQATPYIPNKNSVDPSKQAIFKSGGGYSKRFIHSHRIGGGVC